MISERRPTVAMSLNTRGLERPDCTGKSPEETAGPKPLLVGHRDVHRDVVWICPVLIRALKHTALLYTCDHCVFVSGYVTVLNLNVKWVM